MTPLTTMAFTLAVLLGGVGAAPATAGTPPLACVPAGLSCENAPVGFEPEYPTGTEYDIFIGPSFGIEITDSDGDGDYNDEGCSVEEEAILAEIHAGVGLLVALGAGCEALPSGPNIACTTPPVVPHPSAQEFCSAALAVTAAALEVSSVFITRCALQGGFVEGAEIEASYENSKLILARDLEEHLRACNKLVSLFLPRSVGGRLEEVRAFVQLRIDQFEEADLRSPDDFSGEIARAKKNLAQGDGKLTKSNYRSFKDAYRNYCDAYRELRNIHL